MMLSCNNNKCMITTVTVSQIEEYVNMMANYKYSRIK